MAGVVVTPRCDVSEAHMFMTPQCLPEGVQSLPTSQKWHASSAPLFCATFLPWVNRGCFPKEDSHAAD